jgi:hypothetical protein
MRTVAFLGLSNAMATEDGNFQKRVVPNKIFDSGVVVLMGYAARNRGL